MDLAPRSPCLRDHRLMGRPKPGRDALPFFSKANLRRHADDFRRMGSTVSWLPVDIV